MNINDLSNPNETKRLHEEYFNNNTASENGIGVSSHWHDCLKHCQVQVDDDGTVALLRGFGFGDLQYTQLWHRLMNILCINSYICKMDKERKSRIRKISKLSRQILRSMGIPMSYDCFRQICSLSSISDRVEADGVVPNKILVIGDGFGFLSSLIKLLWPSCVITLVDIGPVLFFQAVNIQRLFPKAKHSFIFVDKQANNIGYDFCYCPCEYRESLTTDDFSLVVNIASMQEMTTNMIKEYFKFIRDRVDAANYFYCCNRETKVLIGGEKIVFDEYPWSQNDNIYFDVSPDFYKYYYSCRPNFKHYFEPFRHRLVQLR